VFNEDGTEPTAEEVQVLIYSSSRFGPHSLRDLTVGGPSLALHLHQPIVQAS
jgi:hypothetical protein